MRYPEKGSRETLAVTYYAVFRPICTQKTANVFRNCARCSRSSVISAAYVWRVIALICCTRLMAGLAFISISMDVPSRSAMRHIMSNGI